jgi:hypothetical protein
VPKRGSISLIGNKRGGTGLEGIEEAEVGWSGEMESEFEGGGGGPSWRNRRPGRNFILFLSIKSASSLRNFSSLNFSLTSASEPDCSCCSLKN